MTKLINISNEVYATLTSLKGEESYSFVIKKLLEQGTNKEKVLQLYGKGGIDEKKIGELNKGWKKWSTKYA